MAEVFIRLDTGVFIRVFIFHKIQKIQLIFIIKLGNLNEVDYAPYITKYIIKNANNVSVKTMYYLF